MWVLAQMQRPPGDDLRMYLYIGSMILVGVILFLAAIAVFVGRERSQRPDA